MTGWNIILGCARARGSDMSRGYNELTKRLLAEGYTAARYPDYVHIGHSGEYGKQPLENCKGGFEYNWQYIIKQTFRTPCGILCLGKSCMTAMSYKGIDWTFENDLAHIHCPYRKVCGLRDPRLPLDGIVGNFCAVHMTKEAYVYEGSLEDLKRKRDEQIDRQKADFIAKRHGRACILQMTYDYDKTEWKMSYDPSQCARLCSNVYCPILGKELDKKKGNVFYDLKTVRRRKELDGTIFEGEKTVCVRKGIKVFERSMSMDICRKYVQLCKDDLIAWIRLNHHSELYFGRCKGGDGFELEVLNIRAERKESRDLIQDLRDIEDGILVVHASDEKKAATAQKSETRKVSRQKKIARLEKKLLEVGYENLESCSLDKIHADEWLGAERIDELETLRLKRLQQKEKEPRQLTIFG